MSEYIKPDLKTQFTNPIKALEIEQKRPSSTGNVAKRAFIELEHAFLNRAYVLHAASVDLVKAGATGAKSARDWTLFVGKHMPFISVDNQYTAEKALRTSAKTLKYLAAAAGSLFVGLIKPDWALSLHKYLKLHETEVAPAPYDDQGMREGYKKYGEVRDELFGKFHDDANNRQNWARAIDCEMARALDRKKPFDAKSLEPKVREQYKWMKKADELRKVQDSPTEMISKILEDKGKGECGDMAKAVRAELEASILTVPGVYNRNIGDEVNKLQTLVRTTSNRLELNNIYYDLVGKYGEDFAEDYMSNWEGVGYDVRDNKILITEELKKKILFQADLHYLCKQKNLKPEDFYNKLASVEDRVKRGDLPLDNKLIDKEFPILKEVIQKDDDFRKKLDKINKDRLITNARRNPAKFKPQPLEEKIYRLFGWDVDKLNNDTNAVEAKLESLFETLLKAESGSSDMLKAEIGNLTVRAKIEAMGGDPARTKLVQFLIDDYQKKFKEKGREFSKEINDKIQNMIDNEQSLKNYPLFKKQLYRECAFDSDKLALQLMKSFSQQIKNHSNIQEMDDDQIKGHLEEKYKKLPEDKMKQIRIDNRQEKIKEQIQSYKNWPNHLGKEMIQGIDDQQEISMQGVCWALCYRMTMAEINNPEISLKDLSEQVEIKAEDRINQAQYLLALHLGKTPQLRKNNIQTTQVGRKKIENLKEFAVEASNFLEKEENQELLKSNHYNVNLFIGGDGWGHAVYFRADPYQRSFHFFDPNIGLSINFDDSETMLKCFQDFMKQLYSDAQYITFTTLESQKISN